MSWTDNRVATLTKLWTDGESASAIARALGEVTRNAVIGKVPSARPCRSRDDLAPPTCGRPISFS